MARILIVEDESLLAQSLADSLEQSEHQVAGMALSAEDAIQKVEETAPDLILMDIRLQGEMDGIEAAERLRRLHDIPVVYMTGHRDEETVSRAKLTEPYAYLTKPIRPSELRRIVEITLYKHQCDKRVRENEERLIKSEELNRSLVVNAPMAIIYLGSQGTIEYANPATATLFGFPRDVPSPFLGASLFDLPFLQYNQEMAEHLERLFQGGAVNNVEFTYCSPMTGKVFYLMVSASPRFDGKGEMVGAVVMFADITGQKMAESALRESEAQKRAILDGITTNLTFINQDMEILWTNRAASDSVKMSPEEMRGSKCYMLCGADKGPCQGCPALETLRTGNTHRAQVTTPRGRIMDVVSTPVESEDGELTGILVIAADITEEKKTQELFLQAEKYRAVVDLSAGVAHNFNNLLQIVVGNISLALKNLQAGKHTLVEKNLNRVLQSSEFGAETIKRLNRLANSAKTSEWGESGPFDLTELAEQACEMTKPLWRDEPSRKGLHISLDCKLSQGCSIKGNKSEIFEVILNLIGNAVNALEYGGHIEIRTFRQGDRVSLKVSDTGVGISENNIKRIFTPFFTTSMEVGKGLGLATCRTIIESHGGHIFVESSEGKGTTFSVELPFSPIKDQLSSDHGAISPIKPLSIIVAEDKEGVLNMLQSGLEMYGHTVYPVLSGEKALEVFSETAVDLVICDLSMPGLNGWEVGERMMGVTARQGKAKIPFILLTGWTDAFNQSEKIRASGVDAIVEKPVAPESLVNLIQEVKWGKQGLL